MGWSSAENEILTVSQVLITSVCRNCTNTVIFRDRVDCVNLV